MQDALSHSWVPVTYLDEPAFCSSDEVISSMVPAVEGSSVTCTGGITSQVTVNGISLWEYVWLLLLHIDIFHRRHFNMSLTWCKPWLNSGLQLQAPGIVRVSHHKCYLAIIFIPHYC